MDGRKGTPPPLEIFCKSFPRGGGKGFNGQIRWNWYCLTYDVGDSFEIPNQGPNSYYKIMNKSVA